MTLSMSGFAVEDLFLKILSSSVPVSQILIYVGISASSLLALISIIKRIPILSSDFYSNKFFVIRSIADMMGAVFIVTSISLMPLSTVSSILQALPLFITIGAVLIFKESVGWRRWSAVSLGFIGVLLILKPGINSFHFPSLIILIGVAFLALRDLITRKITKDIHSITVSLYAFILTTLGGVISLPFFGNFVVLTITQWFIILIITMIGSFSYFMLVLATRKGDISAISPFRYSRIIFALFLAIIVLNERPDHLSFFGVGIIIVAGYYTIWRERILYLK